MGRAAYAYGHAVMVAGVIVAAVADELVIAHPRRPRRRGRWVILGGPRIYLAGNALFLGPHRPRARHAPRRPRRPGPARRPAPVLTPLGLAIAATVVVVALVATDARSRLSPAASLFPR